MKNLLTLTISLLFLSCGSNTAIVNSWKDSDSNIDKEKFKKVLVVALIKDEATRRTVENKITERNPIFRSSYTLLNEKNLDLSKDEKLKLIQNADFDGAITMRLVSIQKETYYQPGTNTSAYYGGMGDAYNNSYGSGFGNWYGAYSYNYYTPGYYVEDSYFIVETNIFSLTQNKLLWTGTTKSLNIDNINKTTDEIIEEVIKQMKKDGFMEKK